MNILISGVGGQGSLLASRILGHVFMRQGLDVKVNEVHGMSQRGGSVVTTVRAGQLVHSPLIPDGEVDLLIAMEQMEALRWLHTLRPEGAAVVNTQKIAPLPVLTGNARYPEGITERFTSSSVFLDAVALANQAGSLKAVNVVLLGAASLWIDTTKEHWQSALEACVKPKFLSVNQAAFELGIEAAKEVL